MSRTEEQLEIIRRLNPHLKAFITIDGKAGGGSEKGKLAGVTVAVKDNICVSGIRCTASSKVLEDYVAPYDASVIERLKAEGATIIGKTNMDEFAAGGSGTSGYFGPVKNPFDIERVPGGSSSGSAVAVAAGMADIALGSDTAGSIRCPASFCGLAGFRPTYGAVSRYGLLDLGMSMDTIGPMARDVAGCLTLMDILAFKDPRDQTSVELPRTQKTTKTIGVPKQFLEGVDEKVLLVFGSALKIFEKEYEVVEVDLPISKYAVPIYYLTVFSEFSSAMQKFDGLKYGHSTEKTTTLPETVAKSRSESFGREVKRRVLLGTYITMKEQRDRWYTSAIKARSVLKTEFEKTFRKVDLLLGPTMPHLPWKFGEKADPLQEYFADVLTTQASLAGIPAGSVPAGVVDGLPVGIQIHGPRFSDFSVLEAMRRFEEKRGRLHFELDRRLPK